MTIELKYEQEIKTRFQEFINSTDTDQHGLRPIAAKLNALPLFLDMGGCYAIRPDGEIIVFGWEDEKNFQIEYNPRLRNIALNQGSKKYPKLKELISTRSKGEKKMRTMHYLVLSMLLGNLFALQGISQDKSQMDQKARVAKNTPLKLTLNGSEMGTTDDTSILSRTLKEVLDQRPDAHKSVYLLADRSVSAEEIARLFGALNRSDASPILIPLQMKERTDIMPPVDLLAVYAGSGELGGTSTTLIKPHSFGRGIEINFIGELFDNLSSAPPDLGVPAIVAQKDGTYRIEGKQVSASNLKIAIENRLKTKVRKRRIVLVQAENYGSIDDVASIAGSAGAVKIYLVTKNLEHKENDISFSLPPAFRKDKSDEETSGLQSVRFSGPDASSFTIDLGDKFVEKALAEAEVKQWYEDKKREFRDAEVSLTEIDGQSGVLTIQSDKEFPCHAYWWGWRRKDGKQQLVMISFVSKREESKHSRYEFLQIMKSIKFN